MSSWVSHADADADGSEDAPNPLDDALHALAQPLTAVLFVLETAKMQKDPEVWRRALDTAIGECHRAASLLENARTVAEGYEPALGDGGGVAR